MDSIKKPKYKLIAPDGGWGHMINIGGILMVGLTVGPLSSFALIFGPFVSQFQDETSATTTITSVFSTVFYTTGLLSYFLLLKLSTRKVALIGALLYCCGSFSSIFVKNFRFIIISYGILQGLGTGLIVPAVLTATNEYFDKKKTLVIGITQAVVALMGLIYPAFTRILLDNFGFRGTQAIFAVMSLHIVFGALTLHPVKKHMKKVLIDIDEEEEESEASLPSKTESNLLLNDHQIEKNVSYDEAKDELYSDLNNSTGNVSVIMTEGKQKRTFYQNIFDFSLLKEPTYYNIAVGISLCVTSEMTLMTLLPIFLSNVGFTKNEITMLLTIYFTSDLITKIIISVISFYCRFKNRELLLGTIFFTIIFRIVFTEINLKWCTITCIALLGSSRCIIQFSYPSVLAEKYPKRFSSAYSLAMVFTGISSLIVGSIVGVVKYKTQSDFIVQHVLTSVLLICFLIWSAEMIYKRYLLKKCKI